MKPALAHLSPTVPAALAAGIGIALSVFLLPGIGGQGEPTPLLPAIGGVAGRVAADLPAPASERASEPVGKVPSPAQFVATRTEHFVPQRRQAATKAHRVHRRARPGVVRRAPSTPAQVAAPAAPATPFTTQRFFSTPPTAKGKARGHGHGRTLEPTAGAPAPGSHGHGKALGRSSEHHRGLPPGHAKKAPAAPSPAPAASPKANGGGNGHKGGKK